MTTVQKAGPSLLLGRDDELALVEQLVDAVRSGAGGCVYLIGEAGAGKTVLVRHAQARAAGLTVLASQGWRARPTSRTRGCTASCTR